MPVQGKTVGEYVISGDLILGLARDLRPVPADPEKFRLAIMGKMVGHGWKKDSGFLWPHGLIPVLFEPNLPDNIRNSMLKAMSEWNSQTNIKFIDVLGLTRDQRNILEDMIKNNQIGKKVVVTTQSDGGERCNSYVGKQNLLNIKNGKIKIIE